MIWSMSSDRYVLYRSSNHSIYMYNIAWMHMDERTMRVKFVKRKKNWICSNFSLEFNSTTNPIVTEWKWTKKEEEKKDIDTAERGRKNSTFVL